MSAYTWNAVDYEKNSTAQQKWARELLDKLSLTGTENILDIGCGDGKVTAEIARAVPEGRVIGIDNSTAMIALAQERYPASQYPNLSFQVMDARQISFQECFHVVFSNAALHWVKDHRPVAEGAYNSLRSGGKILFQMGGEGNAGDILSVLDEMLSSPKWQPYFEGFAFPYRFHGIKEYEVLLRDAGFTLKRVELIPKAMEQDGKAGLKGWIRTTWLPYTQQIPNAVQEEFIEELATRYLTKVPITSDGKAYVAMVRIESEAVKLT